MSVLHAAVLAGDVQLICAILDHDPTIVNDWDIDYNTPLHLIYDHVDAENPTIADDRIPVMQVLLDHGAYINAVNIDNVTPLHLAVSKSQFNGVKRLLENGADPNIRDSSLTTPLHVAIALNNNSDNYIDLFMNFSTNIINVRNSFGTPLEKTILPQITESAMTLLQKGAKVKDVYDLLLSALNNENMESVEFILQYSVQMDLHDRFSLGNVLFYKKFGYYYFIEDHEQMQLKIMQLLMAKNININKIQEERKISALQCASENLNESEVKLLLDAGADVNSTDSCGNTPLHSVLSNSNRNDDKIVKIAKMLIDKEADVSKINCFGCRPFNLAVKNLHVNVINLILSKLSEIDVVELNNTQKCLEWLISIEDDYIKYYLDELSVAIILGYITVVERLLDKRLVFDADMEFFDIPNHYLYYAASENQIEIVKMLIDSGYDDCRHDLIINWDKLNQIDPTIVCMLWETNNNSLLKTMFFETIRNSMINPTSVTEFHGRSYIEIFYYAIKLRKYKLNIDLFAVNRIFKHNQSLIMAMMHCNDKLDDLKDEQVCDNLNMLHIISMNPESFESFLKNHTLYWCCENLFSSLECKSILSVHERILLERIGFAILNMKRSAGTMSNISNVPMLSS